MAPLLNRPFDEEASVIGWFEKLFENSDDLKLSRRPVFAPHALTKHDTTGKMGVAPVAVRMHHNGERHDYLLLIQENYANEPTIRVYFAFLAPSGDGESLVVELTRSFARQFLNKTQVCDIDAEWLIPMASGLHFVDFAMPASSWLQTLKQAPKVKVRAIFVSPTSRNVGDAVVRKFAVHARDATAKLRDAIANTLTIKLADPKKASTSSTSTQPLVQEEASETEGEEDSSMTDESMPSNDTQPSSSNSIHSDASDTSSESEKSSESDVSNLIAETDASDTSSEASDDSARGPRPKRQRVIYDSEDEQEERVEAVAANLMTATVAALKELKEITPREQYEAVIARMLASLERRL